MSAVHCPYQEADAAEVKGSATPHFRSQLHTVIIYLVTVFFRGVVRAVKNVNASICVVVGATIVQLRCCGLDLDMIVLDREFDYRQSIS